MSRLISWIKRALKKLPALVKQAKIDAPYDMSVQLLFQEEARFGRVNDWRRWWAPLLRSPVVGHQVIRGYVYALTTTNPRDGRLILLVMPWVDAETFTLDKHSSSAMSLYKT